MIKAIVIEDDEESRHLITNLLSDNFKQVNVVAVCSSNDDAKDAIEELEPELIFSDIELGRQAVFSMLQELSYRSFEIIFITGYDTYAIQAIRFSALDYILKPFGVDELSVAIKQYEKNKNKQESWQQLDTLFHNFNHIRKDLKRVALPTANGFEVFAVKDVIRCQANVNYTTFYLITQNKIVVAKTLKEYEELFSDYNFFRIHHSHLINLHHVKKYVKKDGGTVIMTDGTEIEVSRRKKDEFLEKLEAL